MKKFKFKNTNGETLIFSEKDIFSAELLYKSREYAIIPVTKLIRFIPENPNDLDFLHKKHKLCNTDVLLIKNRYFGVFGMFLLEYRKDQIPNLFYKKDWLDISGKDCLPDNKKNIRKELALINSLKKRITTNESYLTPELFIEETDKYFFNKALTKEYDYWGEKMPLNILLKKFKPISKKIEQHTENKNRHIDFKLINKNNDEIFVSEIIYKYIKLPYQETMKTGGNLIFRDTLINTDFIGNQKNGTLKSENGCILKYAKTGKTYSFTTQRNGEKRNHKNKTKQELNTYLYKHGFVPVFKPKMRKGGRIDNNWNSIPDDLKYYTPVNKLDYQKNPDNKNLLRILKPFAVKDESNIRPTNYIYADKYGVTVTNSLALIHINSKPYKKGFFSTKGEKIEIPETEEKKYPDYISIVPAEFKEVYNLNVEKLKMYLEIIGRFFDTTNTNYYGFFPITLILNEEKQITFDIVLLTKFLKAILLLGYKELQFGFNRNDSVVTLSENIKELNVAKDTFFLIMPLIYNENRLKNISFNLKTNKVVSGGGEYELNTGITKKVISETNKLLEKTLAEKRKRNKKIFAIIKLIKSKLNNKKS